MRVQGSNSQLFVMRGGAKSRLICMLPISSACCTSRYAPGSLSSLDWSGKHCIASLWASFCALCETLAMRPGLLSRLLVAVCSVFVGLCVAWIGFISSGDESPVPLAFGFLLFTLISNVVLRAVVLGETYSCG